MTTLRDIDDFLPRVIEKAPSCPEPVAIAKLRDAAREFLRATRLWREEDSFTVAAVAENNIPAPAETEIYEIAHATFLADDAVSGTDPTILTPKSIRDLDRDNPDWRTEDSATPEFITQMSPNTMRLSPNDAGTLTVELILLPSEDAVSLPEFLYWHHAEGLAHGALGRLLAIPGSFFNGPLASDERSMWQDYLSTWANRASKGQQRAPRRTRTMSMY